LIDGRPRGHRGEARQAKVLTKNKARRIAINIARLPEFLGKGGPTDMVCTSLRYRRHHPAISRGAPDPSAMADLTDTQRAVLRMLAKSPRGYALSTVMARGFTFAMLQDLVRTGFATTQRDAVGLSKTKVPHLRITEVGRKAIAD
jgi:hypothetical protein